MMVDDQWVPIERGMVIPDARVIRTGANGQVTFRSGNQLIDLSRDTQIQISAAHGRDHTWILHAGGELTADVEARDVEHFGVRTQHMVAVVKGTRFTVSADEQTAGVSVERGTVAINENERGLSVSITSGQRAHGGNGQLQVGGEGDLPDVIDATGRPLPLQEARIDPSSGDQMGVRASAQQTGLFPGGSREQVGPPSHSNAIGTRRPGDDERGETGHGNAVGNQGGDADERGPASQSHAGENQGTGSDGRGPSSHDNAGGKRH